MDPKVLESAKPAANLIFRAVAEMMPMSVRVVILGQDVYPTPGKAVGRAFALSPAWVKETDYVPHSTIANIIKELKDDTGEDLSDLSLQHWVDQGVLLINTRLTVGDAPMSHAKLGWEPVVGDLLKTATSQARPVVVVAWGAEARKFAEKYVNDKKRNIIITSAHPCRRSAARGFFGSKPFSMVNDLLKEVGQEPIRWGARPT